MPPTYVPGKSMSDPPATFTAGRLVAGAGGDGRPSGSAVGGWWVTGTKYLPSPVATAPPVTSISEARTVPAPLTIDASALFESTTTAPGTVAATIPSPLIE